MNTNNAPPDHRPLSRSTSRASSRTRGSTLSRQQSLIKKNIELQDLKPADVLIERFVAWKAIVKQLTAYFEGIADIENNTAKELTKLAGVIQVPFRAGNQFLGEGGLQDIYYDIRDKTRIIADQHADLGRTIDSSIVQHLNKLRAEIKAHIKNVQNDTGKLAASVARERELSTKLVGELANAVSTLTNTPGAIHARNDPYIANQAVARQLQHQVHEENMLQKSIVIMQQNSAHFEEGIVQSIQSAWQTFDEWQSRASAASQEVFRALAQHMASLRPDHEWIQFAARSDHLLDPETPLRDPAYINYPLKDHHSTKPIHVGHLERKKRFTRAYHEAYFVLTPAGFLHEFASSDPTTHAGQTPTFSLYLPTCTLGPASSPRAKAHKFHIEGRKDGVGATKTKTGSFRGLLGGQGSLAWSFRARSHEDMLEWWNDVRELCARYLVASEQVDRTGPVEEAVRSVGYLSEEEEELEEEEEEEEEEEVATADEGEGDVVEAAAPGAAKAHPHRGRILEVHDAQAERAARARGMEGPAPAPAQAAEPHEEDAEPEHEGSSVEEEVDEHEHEHEHDHPHAAPGPEPSLAGHAPADDDHDQEHEHEHEHEEPPVYAAEKGYQHQLLNGKGGGVGAGGVEVGPNAYADYLLDLSHVGSFLSFHFHFYFDFNFHFHFNFKFTLDSCSCSCFISNFNSSTLRGTPTFFDRNVIRFGLQHPLLILLPLPLPQLEKKSLQGLLGPIPISLSIGPEDGQTKTVPRYTPKPVLINRGNSDIRSTHGMLVGQDELELESAGCWGGNGAVGAGVGDVGDTAAPAYDGHQNVDPRRRKRLSQRQMEKARAREVDAGAGAGAPTPLNRQDTGGEGVDTGSGTAPGLGQAADPSPYYAHPSPFEDTNQPTHAVHRAPTGGKVKYAPPPADAAPRPRMPRADSGSGSGSGGGGHARPRSPPPPSARRDREAKDQEHGQVRGYDDVTGDQSDQEGTALSRASTISRAQVDEIPSDEDGSSSEDDLCLSHGHRHKFARVQKDVAPGQMLDDGGGGGGGGGKAAAAAYAADHELAAETQRKAGGAGVDAVGGDAVAVAKDPRVSVGVAGGPGVDEKAQGGGKKAKTSGGPISWLFGD